MNLYKRFINMFRGCVRNKGLNNKIIIIKQDGTRFIPGILYLKKHFKGSKIVFSGNDNLIEIYEPYGHLRLDVSVWQNTHVVLQPSKYQRKIKIAGFRNFNNNIIIGRDLYTTNVVDISILRGNKNIIIGDDCLFSWGIKFQMGDGHAIIDLKTEKPVNENKDIIVGNHVWLGAGVMLLRGAIVPNGCIVGTRSLVTKPFNQENSIIAGVPAKQIKTDISWQRESFYDLVTSE